MNQRRRVLEPVTLYGVDHSPWVQGIRLALAHHRVPMKTTSVPISLRWVWSKGVTFPVLQSNAGTAIVDSFAMYSALESDGYDLGLHNVSEQRALEAQATLETMFSNYALGRSGPNKRWEFIRAWSVMRERPQRVAGVASRAFLTHYFFILIELGRVARRLEGLKVYDLEQFEADVAHWDAQLRENDWLTGDGPGALDFALFGHIQCMTSGLTDELLPILRNQAALMSWVDRMNTAMEGYQPLYTPRLKDESETNTEHSHTNTWAFWCAWLGWIVVCPLTIPLLMRCLWRRAFNPAHTGAVTRRHSRRRGAF